jgi:hypothetical protein
MADLFREKKYCWLTADKSLRWNNDWHIPHPWIQAMCGDVQRPTDNERAAVIPRRFVCRALQTRSVRLFRRISSSSSGFINTDEFSDTARTGTQMVFLTPRFTLRLFDCRISACLDLFPRTEYYSFYQPNTLFVVGLTGPPLCRWTHWTLLAFCDRPLTWNFVIKSVSHLLSLVYTSGSSTTFKFFF